MDGEHWKPEEDNMSFEEAKRNMEIVKTLEEFQLLAPVGKNEVGSLSYPITHNTNYFQTSS
jgi:hypothetical protein